MSIEGKTGGGVTCELCGETVDGTRMVTCAACGELRCDVCCYKGVCDLCEQPDPDYGLGDEAERGDDD